MRSIDSRGACAARCALILGACLASSGAAAAGHFDVDDADTLAQGRCQLELWAGQVRSGGDSFQHVGPACRVGAVELHLDIDRVAGAQGRAVSAGPAVKWTWYGQPEDPLRAALALGASWDLRRHGRPARQLLLPLSWDLAPALSLHANVGADWAAGSGERTWRTGAAAHWTVREGLTLVLERNRAFNAWTTRTGVQWELGDGWRLDLSTARMQPGRTVLTMGLNREWGR